LARASATFSFLERNSLLASVYYQAALFPNKNAAGKAYTPIESIIHEVACDLSAYRLLRPKEKQWLVVVIGQQPPPQLHERLKTILISLTRGKPTTLDDETLAYLLSRRLQQIQRGQWVEGHYSTPEDE
jgi:hypothetical protein